MCEAPCEQRCGTLGDLHAYGRQSWSSLGACVSFPPGGQVVHVFSQGDNVRRDIGLSACQLEAGLELPGRGLVIPTWWLFCACVCPKGQCATGCCCLRGSGLFVVRKPTE